MATKVFISYRRATGSGYALLIYDHLRRRLPDIFRDQNSLTTGERFGDELEQAIGRCEAMIVVVTPGWAETFRVNQEKSDEDWVLKEIRTASAANKQIVPVLAGGATADELVKVPDLPGLATVRDIQSASLHERDYETDLDHLARLLWRWPPPRYWVSSTLLLAAAVTFALWFDRAAGWGTRWWAFALVLLLAWLVPNAIALSGRIYPLLPGTGRLRGLASSAFGPTVAAVCIVIALVPPVGWRIIRIEGGKTRPSSVYQLTEANTVWSRTIDSGGIHTYLFPVWTWTPVEVLDPGDHAGRCVESIPAAFASFTITVPDGLAPNAIVISAEDTLKRRLSGAHMGLRITPLVGESRGNSLVRNLYDAEPVRLDVNPCESLPTAVEIVWSGIESELSIFDHLKRLVQGSPWRYVVPGGDARTREIVLKGSD